MSRKTVKFSEKGLADNSKRVFTTTLFHDNDTWKVQPFNSVANGAVSDDADNDAQAHPCIRVQRIVNGSPVGKIERLFLSSVYNDDETAEGELILKTGRVNILIKQTWDNPAFASDESATKACVDAIFDLHKDGIITCHRTLAKGPQGNILKKLTYEGNLRPIILINWD